MTTCESCGREGVDVDERHKGYVPASGVPAPGVREIFGGDTRRHADRKICAECWADPDKHPFDENDEGMPCGSCGEGFGAHSERGVPDADYYNQSGAHVPDEHVGAAVGGPEAQHYFKVHVPIHEQEYGGPGQDYSSEQDYIDRRFDGSPEEAHNWDHTWESSDPSDPSRVYNHSHEGFTFYPSPPYQGGEGSDEPATDPDDREQVREHLLEDPDEDQGHGWEEGHAGWADVEKDPIAQHEAEHQGGNVNHSHEFHYSSRRMAVAAPAEGQGYHLHWNEMGTDSPGAGVVEPVDLDDEAGMINVDTNAASGTCSHCGQPIVQFSNGGWEHATPGVDTCGHPEPSAGLRTSAIVKTANCDCGHSWGAHSPDGKRCESCTDNDGWCGASNAHPAWPADKKKDKKKSGLQQWDEDQSWFDGKAASIHKRVAMGHALIGDLTREGASADADRIAIELDVLRKAAAEYERDYLEEHYANNLPGFYVAQDYAHVLEGGMLDIGDPDDSFLFTAAKAVQDEYRDYDWNAFVTEGAKAWIAQRAAGNKGILRFERVTHEAAVDYARDLTTPIMDVPRRALIIETFATNVERLRRSAYATVRTAELQAEEQEAHAEQERAYGIGQILDDAGLLW